MGLQKERTRTLQKFQGCCCLWKMHLEDVVSEGGASIATKMVAMKEEVTHQQARSYYHH